ncbi:MAG: (E)-4-hydroxy-3-methylbut-2-enyl-diphosphate synthase [Bacteroidetes bacterium]|nr:(E)-4-hydroxy-3-methylbut-2-enyl-diphosphate synthase [Bacteroidota bacterium]MBL6944610.1 (E)-4-hydroxy-3-methylbut-2-enyl-diphosphate synthase [Bacteroidales bacterium]
MAFRSSIVQIGNVALGGKNPVRIQSMTTTNTMDTTATVEQVISLAEAGCDCVRITTQNIKEADNLKNIKNELRKAGVDIPLIADVHFNPKVAEVAAHFVEKVRINPGNYVDKPEAGSSNSFQDNDYEVNRIAKKLIPLLSICKQCGTAIRIGANHGSLSGRILFKYGNTARGMVESIMEFVQVCHKNDFHNLVLSIKASNVVTMIEANMLLVERLSEAGLSYPIHLGVTEAGCNEEGRIKSAAGIGYLLAHGIGDTIRVSLTEDPIEEIPVALKLVEFFGKRENVIKEISPEIINFPKSKFFVVPPVVITSGYSSFSDLSVEKQHMTYVKPTKTCHSERSEARLPNWQESKDVENKLFRYPSLRSRMTAACRLGRKNEVSQNSKCTVEQHIFNEELFYVSKFNYTGLSYDDLIMKAAVEATVTILNQNVDGIWIENSGATSSDNLAKLALNILQVLGLRITKTEYIACPTCGRSSINVIQQLEEVKKQTSHLPGLKIAVMGCAVNGPGEMAGSHYGFVGVGKGEVHIYKRNEIILKNVPQEMATDELINIIKKNGDWKEK